MPSNSGKMPKGAERLQGPLAQEQRGQLVRERPEHVLLCPRGTGAQRRLVEPGHVRGGDQRPDQLGHVADRPGGGGQARVDEPVRDPRPGHVFDQHPAPLDGHVLEHQQVPHQGAQASPCRFTFMSSP
jgi:hypothetical protein